MSKCYVVIYNHKHKKIDGFDCDDPMQGLVLLGRYSIDAAGFKYLSASCFILEPDKLPNRQWHVEIN